MKIETEKPDAPVHVIACEQDIRLGIGEAPGNGCRFTTLSVSQAEMVLHALQLSLADIRERQSRP